MAIINGTAGNDSLAGSNSPDTISGLGGEDTIAGLAGHDVLAGGGGNDVIISHGGADDIFGGAGNDLLVLDRGNSIRDLAVSLIGWGYGAPSSGIDIGDGTVIRGIDRLQMTCGSGDDHVIGGELDDSIAGGDGEDTIDGWIGMDTLNGGGGNDVIESRGPDLIDGGAGIDLAVIGRQFEGGTYTIELGAISDSPIDIGDGTTLTGIEQINFTADSGRDHLTGGALSDTLDGGTGRDVLDGGGGGDVLQSSDRDTLDGGAGRDLLKLDRSGSARDFTISLDGGGSGTDIGDGTIFERFERLSVTCGSGQDRIRGGEHGDTISAGLGVDTVEGLGGNDTITSDDADIIRGGEGRDRLELNRNGLAQGIVLNIADGGGGRNIGDGTRISGIEQLTVHAGAADNSISGGAFGDYMADGFDFFTATYGDDTLAGGAGNDTIWSRGGTDQLEGGDGVDSLNIDRTGETALNIDIRLTAGVGNIGDGTSISGFEILWVTAGSGNDRLAGGDHDDIIEGEGGQDTLTGGGGNDVITSFDDLSIVRGGYGNDHLSGGGGRFYGGAGRDTISCYGENSTAEGGSGVDHLELRCRFVLADLLIDISNGGEGIDIGSGTAISGIEIIEAYAGTGSDTISGGEFSDRLEGYKGSDQLAGRAGDDVLAGEGGSDALFGGTGDDVLTGGSDADLLHGAGGNDRLAGGRGQDNLTGGNGRDAFIWTNETHSGPSQSTRDTVNDFVSGEDILNLSRMDAVAGGTDDQFVFIGEAAFNAAGQIRLQDTAGGTLVLINTEGSGGAETSILLAGINAAILGADDFLL